MFFIILRHIIIIVRHTKTNEKGNDEMYKSLINLINCELQEAEQNFNGWDEAHKLRMAKINGMIEALSLMTGKEYSISKKAELIEKK